MIFTLEITICANVEVEKACSKIRFILLFCENKEKSCIYHKHNFMLVEKPCGELYFILLRCENKVKNLH